MGMNLIKFSMEKVQLNTFKQTQLCFEAVEIGSNDKFWLAKSPDINNRQKGPHEFKDFVRLLIDKMLFSFK